MCYKPLEMASLSNYRWQRSKEIDPQTTEIWPKELNVPSTEIYLIPRYITFLIQYIFFGKDKFTTLKNVLNLIF